MQSKNYIQRIAYMIKAEDDKIKLPKFIRYIVPALLTGVFNIKHYMKHSRTSKGFVGMLMTDPPVQYAGILIYLYVNYCIIFTD